MTPLKLPQVLAFVSRIRVLVTEAGTSQNLGIALTGDPRQPWSLEAMAPRKQEGLRVSVTQPLAQPAGLSLCVLLFPHTFNGLHWSVLLFHVPEGEILIGVIKYHCPLRQSHFRPPAKQIFEWQAHTVKDR